MNIDQVKVDSLGRWPGILTHFGIEVGIGKHCPCPHCGGKDRFIFDNKDGHGTWHCQQCDPHAGDGFALLVKILQIDFVEACKQVDKILGTVEPSKHQPERTITPETLRKIFKDSEPITKGDPGHLYLKNRGLHSMPKMLRVGRVWEAETKENQLAILALFSLADGTAATMHRTYIKDGKKLDIEAPKKFLPALKPLNGGAIRLYEAGPVLGIAEGIETAVACHEQYGIPVWAAIGTSMMAGFEPPKEIESLIVFSDNDLNFAGQRAAYKLANRTVIEKKIPVSVEVPEIAGEDFLDEINRTKEEE